MRCARVWPYLHYQTHDRPEIVRILGHDFIQRHSSLERNVLFFSLIVSLHSDGAIRWILMFFSPAASSYTPPPGRKPWRGGSDTPRWGGPSSPQPRTALPPTQLWMTGKVAKVLASLYCCPFPCVHVYSRRCISLYRIVRAWRELSSVGSRMDTSWAKVKASSCFPVRWRPIAFRTWKKEK